MGIKFKDLIWDLNQWGIFLSGLLFGALLAIIIMSHKFKVKIVELDLNKIIKVYATYAAKSSKEVATLDQDFKQKFNRTLNKLFPTSIVIKHKNLLSKHTSIDYTEEFIEEFKSNE